DSKPDGASRPMRRQQVLRIANDGSQFLLVTTIHNCLSARTAQRHFIHRSVGSTYDHDVAINSRALELNNGSTDCGNIAFHSSLNDHVAAESDSAVLCSTVDSQRAADGRHDSVAVTFNDVRGITWDRFVGGLCLCRGNHAAGPDD